MSTRVPEELRRTVLEETRRAFDLYSSPAAVGSAGPAERCVTREQLGALFRALGQTPTDTEVADLLSICDLDKNGVLSLDEVMALVRKQLDVTYTEDAALKMAFDAIDSDGDGFITHVDLKSVLFSLLPPSSGGEVAAAAVGARQSLPLSDDQIAAMFRLGDPAGSGRMDFEGFRACQPSMRL